MTAAAALFGLIFALSWLFFHRQAANDPGPEPDPTPPTTGEAKATPRRTLCSGPRCKRIEKE